MEITIKYNHGRITMREPFFPCPLRKLKRFILPLLLEDPQGEKVREQMAAYCEEMSWSKHEEAKQLFAEGQHVLDIMHEDDKDKFRARNIRQVKHLENQAIRYKRNAEVIRG